MLEQTNEELASKQQIIDELLQELPSDAAMEVELPSENRVNSQVDPTMPVAIRPMTFEDEKNIVGAKPGVDPINTILARCVTNVKIGELLSLDKLYLIMKLREISYGDDYPTLLICRDCKAENPVTIKLSALNINPVPDDFADPVEVMLPSIKRPAKIRLPRVKDEHIFGDPEKIFTELWRFVLEIGGQTDRGIVAEVIQKLPIKDTRTILNAMKTDFGVDTKIKLECKECGGVSVVDLPIDANFFDVS